MAIKVFPYKAGSRSARALAEACGGRVLRRVGSKYKFRQGDLVINWGGDDCPFIGRGVANQPNAIPNAQNKLTCFKLMKEAGVNVPQFWTDRKDIPNEVFPIVCRTTLTGHSGIGIVIADNRGDVVPAPLYTQYVKKKHEYRVHVIRKPGEEPTVAIVQRKAKRDGVEANFKVRNLANGFVYLIDDATPDCVLAEAKKALECSGLAFGAVDVIWNEKQNKAYVLEINTAPGLEPRTAEAYAKVFKEIAQ